MAAVKDSRIAVRLSSDQDALIRHAAEVEGTSITEFTVAATVTHAIDVLADRRMFVIDDAAWSDFLAVLDRPVRHKPRLEKLFSEPSLFAEEVSDYSLPRPIAEDDDITAFDSGEPSLEEYLRSRALANHVQGASRCFVTCRGERVVGYYALASASVQHSNVAGKVRRNMPDPVPVILLSRLAVDRKEHGTGLGKNLLRDAILRSVEASEIIGVRALLVHALHDHAREFYAHFDFEPSATDPLHLLLLIKDARAVIGR